MVLRIVSIACLLICMDAKGQATDTIWKIFDHFPGKWTGKNTIGNDPTLYSRKYEYILDRSFLKIEESVQKEKNPVLTTLSFISYYKAGKQFVIRQYVKDGTVNLYIFESRTDSSLIFRAEFNENLPQGWKSRLSLILRGKNESIELFETRAPDKEFEQKSRIIYKKEN